jgi:L-ribulokinase
VVAGAHPNYAVAQRAMTGVQKRVFTPDPTAHAVYRKLYSLYRKLHDAFGTKDWNGDLYEVMKKLLKIRQKARK